MQARLNADMQDSLAGRLRFARKARKWTQEKLAAESNVNQSDISKIERGETLRPTSLLALATALQCNPYWLDTGDGEPFASGGASALPPLTGSGGQLPSTKEISPRDAVLALGKMLLGHDSADRDMASALLKNLALQPERAAEFADKLEGLLGGRWHRPADVQPKSRVMRSARIYQFPVRNVTKSGECHGLYESHVYGREV